MEAYQLIFGAISLGLTSFVALAGGWFGQRIHKLEGRINYLEEEQQYQWGRERQLVDFIYRNNLIPPEAPSRND